MKWKFEIQIVDKRAGQVELKAGRVADRSAAPVVDTTADNQFEAWPYPAAAVVESGRSSFHRDTVLALADS